MKKVLLSVLIMAGTVTLAQIPGILSYQGILVQTSGPNVGQPVNDGAHTIRFVFFDAPSGGNIVYETQSFTITTYKGMFTTLIGNSQPSAVANPPIPGSVWTQQIYVEVIADAASQGRVQLTASPYAMRAQTANTMDAAGLTGTVPNAALDADLVDLADGTLTGSKVGAGVPVANITGLGALATLSSVTSATITDATIATADLADGSVTLVKHADNSVNSAKLVDASVATADLADGSVTLVKLADNSVNSAKIVDASIASADMADGSVTLVKHADNSVNSAKIVDASVATADLVDGSVTSAKILDATVATADLADGSVTLAKHADNSVNSAKLVDGSVATTDIADDAVNTAKIGTAGAGDANKVLTTDGSGNPQWELKSAVSPLSGSGANGRVTFWSGTGSLSSSANLFWDNTNSRLGIGTATPSSRFHMAGADWAVNPLLLSATANAAGATLRFTSPDAGNRIYDIIGSTGTGASMGAGSFGIWDDTGGAYRFVINPSGYIGINNFSPTSQLSVNSSVPTRSVNIDHDYAGASTQYGITVDMTGGTGTGAKYGIDCNVTGTSASTTALYGLETDLNPNGGTGTVYGVNSSILASGASGARYGVYSIVATAAGTSSGIGTYSQITGSGTGTHYGVYGYADGAGTNYGVYGFAPSAEAGYAVYASGNMAYTGTITDVSDRRLKTNIQPMPGVLNKVLELRPTTFYYKSKEYSFMQLPEEKQLGLIAQEVEEVFPEVVTDNVHPGVTDADGKAIHLPVEYKGIDYTILVPVLIKAVQEQQAIIDNQNSGIKEMKAELAELRKMVLALQSVNSAEKLSASAGNEK